MGQRYLLDTNIVIYFLGGTLPERAQQFLIKALAEPLIISVISQIELFSWNHADLPYIHKLQIMTSRSEILPLDEEVVSQTIFIRKHYKKTKLPDAIIAATCLAHNFTLITRNSSDFKNIDGLNFINPFDL